MRGVIKGQKGGGERHGKDPLNVSVRLTHAATRGGKVRGTPTQQLARPARSQEMERETQTRKQAFPACSQGTEEGGGQPPSSNVRFLRTHFRRIRGRGGYPRTGRCGECNPKEHSVLTAQGKREREGGTPPYPERREEEKGG